jgi:hypothetical protein
MLTYTGFMRGFAFGNKEYQEVIDICREGIMLCPQYIDLYFLMGNCYMDRDITEAERYVKKIPEAAPGIQ